MIDDDALLKLKDDHDFAGEGEKTEKGEIQHQDLPSPWEQHQQTFDAKK